MVTGGVLRFQYVRNNRWRRGAFRFGGVAATQVRSHLCLDDWQDKTFYTLMEVLDSPWKSGLFNLMGDQEDWYRRTKRHYAILSDNDGYEFLADSWELLPEKAGRQERVQDW